MTEDTSLCGNLNETDILSTTITHLCNITNNLCNNVNHGTQVLQIHYSHLSRTIGDVLNLPEKHFNASKLCSHCSAIWRPGNYTVRILPNKKKRKKDDKVKKMVDPEIKSVQYASPVKQNMKNKNQIIHIKCLNCNKKSIILLNKPKRRKPTKLNETNELTSDMKKKKKKKKKKKMSRDNVSNLSISMNKSFNATLLNNSSTNNSPNLSKTSTPRQNKKMNKHPQPTLTPLQKVSQINKLKLENLLTNSPKKRKSSLGSFLNELF